MDLDFDEALLTKIIVILIIGIAVVGIVVGLKVTGVLDSVLNGGGGSDFENSTYDSENNELPDDDSQISKPWKGYDEDKPKEYYEPEYNWTYKSQNMSIGLFIKNTTLQKFVRKPRIAININNHSELQKYGEYVVTKNDDDAIHSISEKILDRSRQYGWGDYDTVMNALNFVQTIPYEYDNITHPESNGDYTNYPLETLAFEKGDCEDHAILAAAILSEMGYPVVMPVYNVTYDRGFFIQAHMALCIKCDKSVHGYRYILDKKIPAGRFAYYPENATYSTKPGAKTENEDTRYTGCATCYCEDCAPQILNNATYFVCNGTFTAEKFINGEIASKMRAGKFPHYVIDNATGIVPEYYYFVETTAPSNIGDVTKQYGYYQPDFITGDFSEGDRIFHDDRIDHNLTAELRHPSVDNGKPDEHLTSANSDSNYVTEDMRIPVSDYSLEGNDNIWQYERDQYFSNAWVSSGVKWYLAEKWKLNDFQVDVTENQTLYDPWGRTYISPMAAWRIKYEITEMDETDCYDHMTPFSDVRFAVYKNDCNSTKSLYRTFSWQSLNGAEKTKYEYFYETGKYDIFVFVRNCEVDVDIELNVKKDTKSLLEGKNR